MGIMIDDEIKNAVEVCSYQYQLPANLVLAICQIESSFDPWAFRYEPQYKYLLGDRLTMSLTEKFGQMCSWGLMQVMGGVAREHGYKGPLPQLCLPDLGVNYGCKHLQKFFLKYKNYPDAIASYNAGSPRRLEAGGDYVNQYYVKNVQAAWNAFDVKAQL